MSKDRFDELFTKRQELRQQLDAVETELREVGQLLQKQLAEVFPTTEEVRSATRRARRPSGEAGDDKGKRQPSLKEVVQEILTKNSRGLELKEIVAEVTRMISAGEYHSRSHNVTPIVSQAIHALKQDRLIVVEKTASNSRVYCLNLNPPATTVAEPATVAV